MTAFWSVYTFVDEKVSRYGLEFNSSVPHSLASGQATDVNVNTSIAKTHPWHSPPNLRQVLGIGTAWGMILSNGLGLPFRGFPPLCGVHPFPYDTGKTLYTCQLQERRRYFAKMIVPCLRLRGR